MVRYLLFGLLLGPALSHAQFNYVTDQTIPVSAGDGSALSMAWAGGINAAQYNTLDLNGDGTDDLVLFDRMANKVLTFINDNKQYRYAPEYEVFFPDDITNWILLRDYNCDGKKDLFTGDILGMKVYKNTTALGQPPTWQKYFFYVEAGEPKSPVVLTKGIEDLVNLQLQFDDLPSISDVDGDGDLDIMNIRYAGDGTIEYHKNLSKENNNGSCDSLHFKRITQKWGNFKECTCGVFAFHDTDCPPAGGRIEHAGGKSLLALDVDGDADLDLLFSEASCNKLSLLRNEGTTENPIINSNSYFPETQPVDFYIFPAVYFEDVDFDGVKDLIATPNIYSKVYLNSDLSASNWFYKNTGSNQTPSFTFRKRDFLQDKMIDVGNNAVPAFADYDNDGDSDMFISQHAAGNFIATVSLFENVGTISAPVFRFITNDYGNLSRFNYINLKIQFADVNADGHQDLVYTATVINSNTTKLYYVENKNGHFDFLTETPHEHSLAISSTENVSLIDVDFDGVPDLLIGKNNGALEYWRNSGSMTFTKRSSAYLGLGSSTLRQSLACAAGDLNADGEADLILCDQSGSPQIISNFRNEEASRSINDLMYNPLTQNYYTRNFGGHLWPAIVNLYHTDTPAIVVGNILGGVQVLRNNGGKTISEEPVFDIYPNPLLGNETLHIKVDRKVSLQIFSSQGQKITALLTLTGEEFKLTGFAKGLYLFRITTGKKSYAKRVVVY